MPDVRKLVQADRIRGEDDGETSMLRSMLAEAEGYITSFDWCTPVRKRYFGCGIGGVVAVFLFEFRKKIRGTDDALWVVVGDLPSAYFVVDRAPDPSRALQVYCDLMEEWVDAVRGKRPLSKVFAVEAKPTREHARMLTSRIVFLRRKIIPSCRARQRRLA